MESVLFIENPAQRKPVSFWQIIFLSEEGLYVYRCYMENFIFEMTQQENEPQIFEETSGDLARHSNAPRQPIYPELLIFSLRNFNIRS